MVAGGDWDWEYLRGWLSAPTLERLAACPTPKNSFGDDFSGWRWKDNPCFTVFGDAHIGGDFFEQPFDVWLQNNLSSSASWGGGLWLIAECERVFGLTEPKRVKEVSAPLRWIGPDWEIVVRRISRERNGVADSLAAMGRLHGPRGVGFVSPPSGIIARLDEESARWLSEKDVDDLASSRVRDSGIVFDPGG
ncbi:hypothetical protein V6N12_037803 [Hibiscus sabdariffa]|uniref:RNase H type-1 domain-containing protein n=1 Tax=Hibiscus sabdariffa TaxID=183260 RepID=A0ABR2B2P5_9ROSI